jgi:hypothetical protein
LGTDFLFEKNQKLSFALSWFLFRGMVLLERHSEKLFRFFFARKGISFHEMVRNEIPRVCFYFGSSLLGDGDKLIDIVYGDEKNILRWADQSKQGATKISCTGTTGPTNQPTHHERTPYICTL